jgi:hypothetical protein
MFEMDGSVDAGGVDRFGKALNVAGSCGCG